MRTVNDYLTPEQVLVSSTHTGFQQYHGDTRLGDIAFVYAKDNGGTFTFLPPRITIDGEQFFVTSVQTRDRCKVYFHPWSDEEVVESFTEQSEPAPGVEPVESCIPSVAVLRNFFPAEP